jgi:hypothetical protein
MTIGFERMGTDDFLRFLQVNVNWEGSGDAPNYVTLTVSGPAANESGNEGGSTLYAFSIEKSWRGTIYATARYRFHGGHTTEESNSTEITG